jgi:ribonuclease HI
MTKTPPPGSAKLFVDPLPDSAPAGMYTAYVDGASRGNPGPASYAVILQGPDGKTILELSKYIGRETNNVAEYYALITALDYATTHGVKSLRVRSDSELLVRQIQGKYKVKSADLRPLHERATKLARMLDHFRIEHVPREQNREADRLANVALDNTEAKGGATQNRSGSGFATGSNAASDAGAGTAKSRYVTQRVRAHYVGGALVPMEPLDLPEGAEVSFEVRIPRKNVKLPF